MVKHRLLKHIVNQFEVHSEFESYQELNSGHINDTYLIKTTEEPFYILQRINSNVFPNALDLISNKVLVSLHLQERLKYLSKKELVKKVLCFVKAKDNTFFYKDDEGNYWNTTIFIKDSITYEKTPNKEIAFEAGKITGQFLNLTKDLDITQIKDILPNFHSIKLRYNQLLTAIKKASEKDLLKVKELISFVESNINEMLLIDEAIKNKELPLRLTHSDTKISNILFSGQHKALCLIDTDTVMAGVIHFDYGDAIRTICNSIDEDGTNLDELEFNVEYFESYTSGFIQELKEVSLTEIKYLPLSVKMMPFIMGLRFLTDFLNGNIYYKVNYQNHNFDRAKNQFTLVKRINDNYSEIISFINKKV